DAIHALQRGRDFAGVAALPQVEAALIAMPLADGEAPAVEPAVGDAGRPRPAGQLDLLGAGGVERAVGVPGEPGRAAAGPDRVPHPADGPEIFTGGGRLEVVVRDASRRLDHEVPEGGRGVPGAKPDAAGEERRGRVPV